MKNSPLFPFPFICLILLSLCTVVVSGECLASQQSLLLQLKNSLHFSDYSTKLVNWSESSDCCSWEGVTCEEGRVAHLDLSREGIDGGLDNSSVLFNLQHLKSLVLLGNDFNSTIPSRIGALTNLSHLDLAYSGFRGQIPLDMSRLRSLSVIVLEGNNFSSPVPQFFAKFSNLTLLNLRDCGLQGTFPSWIFQVPTLQIIDLSFNEFLEGTLPEFQKNNSLQELSLSFTKFGGTLPTSLGNLWNLSTLDLSVCQFNGKLPSSMSNLTQVVFVDLFSNNFIGGVPSFNFSLKLTSIELSHNRLAGEIPSSLFELPSLEMISLSNNQFSGPIHLFKMASSTLLDRLDLSHNNLEGLIPTSFFKLRNLTVLDLSNNKFNGTQHQKMFRGSNFSVKLTYIDLSHNDLGVSEIPLYLFELPSLETILLSNNQFSGPIHEFKMTSSSSLYTLDLSHNNLEGLIPTFIFKLQNLIILDLSYNKFNDTKHQKIFQGYSNLVILDLSCNNLKSFPDLEDLSELQALNLSYNHISEELPESFFLPISLQTLDLHFNQLVGINFLQVLNLSFNQLVGMIPTGSQIQTFSEDSFIGNKGLCGFPLRENCSDKDASGTLFPNATKDNYSDSKRKINWNLLSAEFGLLTGFGLVVLPLIFSRRWRIQYFERVDDIIFKIFPLAVSRKWFLWTAP